MTRHAIAAVTTTALSLPAARAPANADFRPLPGSAHYVEVSDINDAGVVVGSTLDLSGFFLPCKWTGIGDPEPIIGPDAKAIIVFPLSINNAGHVSGGVYSYTRQTGSSSSFGFLSAGQTLTRFAELGAATFWPYAINDSGVIAGMSQFGEAATVDPATGTITTYGRFGAPGARFTSINNAGQLAGTMEYVGGTPVKAFVVLSGATAQILPDLGGDFAAPYAINDAGTVVGQVADADGLSHAARWSAAGQLTLLPLPPGATDAVARDVNAAGQIVGTAFVGDDFHALLWSDGQLTDLNTLLPPNSGWTLNSAAAINNHGQIAGVATYHGHLAAYLLSLEDNPSIPEPAATLAIATATLLPQSRYRRKS